METVWKKRIQMPIGVYVCLTLIFFRFGIFNFIGFFQAVKNSEGEVYLPLVIITLALCAFTAGAAVWAFTGQNEGRIAVLILLPLNILWILLLAGSDLLNNEIEDDKAAVTAIIQQVIVSLFVIGIEWYLMSKKVVEYYKQND